MFLLRKRKKWDWVQVVSAIFLTLLAVVIAVPFWNTLVVSFQTAGSYAKHPFSLWPSAVTLENYSFLFSKGNLLLKAYEGTIVTTVFGTLFGMLFSIMAAYAFSRKFPGKKLFFRLMVFTMFFSGGLVPTYLLFKNMELQNTYTGIVLISLISVYNIIIMKNGYESVPIDLQEAAMMDGANDMLIFWKIMLPLQKPLIATCSLFTIVGYWNNWYWPMLLLNGGDKTVLQLFLRAMVTNLVQEKLESSIFWERMSFTQGIQMAAVFMVMAPVMIVYPFLQKYFTKGMLVGAVKM